MVSELDAAGGRGREGAEDQMEDPLLDDQRAQHQRESAATLGQHHRDESDHQGHHTHRPYRW